MGLFKKKQVTMDRGKIPLMKQGQNLPIFPKFKEESDESLPSFPKLGEDSQVMKPRMPSLPPLMKPQIKMEEEPHLMMPKEEPEYHVPEFEEFQAPIRRPMKPLLGEPNMTRDLFKEHPLNDSKPIFVKLEKYKAAMNDINELKRKLKETEELISEIESIKDQEDKELANWQRHISDIKTKLLEIDSNLFEV